MQSLCYENQFFGTNYHNKSLALRLALKERLRGTRKWPINSYEFARIHHMKNEINWKVISCDENRFHYYVRFTGLNIGVLLIVEISN